MTRVVASVSGDLPGFMVQQRDAIVVASRRAVARQRDDTKKRARLVVRTAFGKTGRRASLAYIRDQTYHDGPAEDAALVHSKRSRGLDGKIADVLAIHTTGGTIRARKSGGFLWVPFAKATSARGRQKRTTRFSFRRGDAVLIPIRPGAWLVFPKGKRGKALKKPVGMLIKKVRIPRRLNFQVVAAAAERDFPHRLLTELKAAGG